ncbi:MAG: hypothetical protein ACOY4R_23080 [Pseudomonadota bacterium]
MKPIGSILVLGVAAAAAAGCTVREGYYAPQSQAAYVPARSTTYVSPTGTTTVTYPATTYYRQDPPSFQKSNVYSSRWDYYRNYQGIHDGPERTGW